MDEFMTYVRYVHHSSAVPIGKIELRAIPDVSRSEVTVAALLFRRFGVFISLKLSFLMSVPAVLVGNVHLNP